jgi:hypothetical protein
MWRNVAAGTTSCFESPRPQHSTVPFGLRPQEKSLPALTCTNVRVDHPFLFIIIDKPTGIVLFIGRVANPTRN